MPVLLDRHQHEYKLSAWIVAFRPQTFNEKIIKNPSLISELGFNKLTMAEGEGFEPSIRIARMPPFQGGTFNHSAILP